MEYLGLFGNGLLTFSWLIGGFAFVMSCFAGRSANWVALTALIVWLAGAATALKWMFS